MSKKDNLRFETLREAMAEVQNSRSEEVGGHTWQGMVERYGESILFAEIVSIVGRLEPIIWHGIGDIEDNMDRLLDLCIDLGNYAEFLYLSFLEREKRGQGPGEKIDNPWAGITNPFDPRQTPQHVDKILTGLSKYPGPILSPEPLPHDETEDNLPDC